MYFFQKIAALGTGYHENDVRPIVKATNVTAMLAIAISSISALTFAMFNTLPANVIQTIGVLLYFLPLYLNSKGSPLFAALTLGLSAALQLTALPVLFFGPDFGIHYFLLPVIILNVIFFPQGEEKKSIPIILFGTVSLIYCEFFLESAYWDLTSRVAFTQILRPAYLVSAILMVCFCFFIFSRELAKARTEVKAQFDRAEELLHNILPKAVANRLRDQQETIADRFSDVTVLFADMVGFTTLASQTKPARLVEILNSFFSAYDDLCEKHHIEKIKTIGDAYMAAAGVPIQSAAHAKQMADFALDMLKTTARISKELNLEINVRIGMNSGPVVAGVIGKRKYIYDLWGETVNLASRMESHGEEGKIQVSPATYELLQSQYKLEPQPPRMIKGIGELKNYVLIATKA